ncbi:MAG: lipoprotein, partial [Betaproteobacteria bacterium]|nr:lipoprotein [Betaproteobacteria bacterium]
LRSAAAILLLLLLLEACGTRGPLYLPPPEQKQPQQEPSRK